MSTPKKVITFKSPNPLTGTYTIFFEANGIGVFIAIHDVTANETVDGITRPPFKQFGYSVNRINLANEVVTPIPVTQNDVIIQTLSTGNNNAIYQFSIDIAKFNRGNNTINLFEG